MSLIVQKFGGTSLGDLARINQAANTVIREVSKGNQVVVVVSAMAGTTNQLARWVQEIAGSRSTEEQDVVLATGEQMTVGFLALALQKKGFLSRSWTGVQLPIRTNNVPGEAEILDIDCGGLWAFLAEGGISVVTGFQGINDAGRITTLGRGGSDITAVALAASLKADRCDIYTDVDGVYRVDPQVVEDAQKMDSLSYEDMLSLSSHGAKVLHPRAVLYASRHRVPLRVLSSFSFEPGTLISLQDRCSKPLSGLTYTLDWTLAESDTPLDFSFQPTAQEIRYKRGGERQFRSVFPQKYLTAHLEKGGPLTEGIYLKDNLVSISLISGILDEVDMNRLRVHFWKVLSDPELPPVHFLATTALQWQLWVDKGAFSSALRLLYHRLHAL